MDMNNNNYNLALQALEALKEENTIQQQEAEAIQAKLQAQLQEQKVKVLFADAVTASSDSILVADLAVMLKQSGLEIGERRLYDWLRGNGYVTRYACGANRPTQRSLRLGVLELKQTALVNAYGKVTVSKTTKVTPKGQLYFFEKIMADKDTINAIADAKRDAKNQARREARKQAKSEKLSS